MHTREAVALGDGQRPPTRDTAPFADGDRPTHLSFNVSARFERATLVSLFVVPSDRAGGRDTCQSTTGGGCAAEVPYERPGMTDAALASCFASACTTPIGVQQYKYTKLSRETTAGQTEITCDD